MEISEKIVHPDAFHVPIYKEGVFWIAYEQSAYYFWLKKGYKPTKKLIKTVGKEIVSIGFPQNTLDKQGIMSHCFPERDESNVKTFLTVIINSRRKSFGLPQLFSVCELLAT